MLSLEVDTTDAFATAVACGYERRGYTKTPTADVTEGDETVTLVNATITPHKHLLRAGLPIGRTYQVQQCVRSNGDPPWLFAFSMIGLLVDAEHRHSAYADAVAILAEYVPAFRAEHVTVVVDPRDRDIEETWRNATGAFAACIHGSESGWATRWNYGHGEELIGRGVTVFLRHPAQGAGHACNPGCGCGRWQALGNVIELQSRRAQYVEVAFGAETLRASAYGGDLYALPEICEAVARFVGSGLDAATARQAVNHVRAVGVLLRAGCLPGPKGSRAVLRRMLLWLANALVPHGLAALQENPAHEAICARVHTLVADPLVADAVCSEQRRRTQGLEQRRRAASAYAAKHPDLPAENLDTAIRQTFGLDLSRDTSHRDLDHREDRS